MNIRPQEEAKDKDGKPGSLPAKDENPKKPKASASETAPSSSSGQPDNSWNPRWRIAYRLSQVLEEKDSLAWFRKATKLYPFEHILLALLETLSVHQERPLTSKGAYFTGVLKNHAGRTK